MTLYRGKDDTGPPVDDTLKTDGSADDLSGATVKFSMESFSGTLKIDANTSNVTIEDAANGKVEYDFADDGSDLDTAGKYWYWWDVTFSNGEDRRYPNDSPGRELEVTKAGKS